MPHTVQSIRNTLEEKENPVFRRGAVGVLFTHIAELKGEIEMWKANADEASVLAGKQAARIAALEAQVGGVEEPHLFEQLAHDKRLKN